MGRQSRDWLDTTGAELRDRGRDSADLGVDLDNQQPLHPCPPVDDNVVSRGESLRGEAQASSSHLRPPRRRCCEPPPPTSGKSIDAEAVPGEGIWARAEPGSAATPPLGPSVHPASDLTRLETYASPM
jgi:hypothetical protein